jgi:hypothetical protein
MKTSPPPNTPLCGDFHTNIGITTRSASDTKKKELIGNYKNAGRDLAPTGKPILVNTHGPRGVA